MKTKTIIFFGALVIVLSTAFAFNSNSSTTAKPLAKEEKTTASKNSGGFVLEDADQWK